MAKYQQYEEYKDSGVEWLGDIPKDWNIARVKNQFNVFNGSTPKSGEVEYWEGDIVWVTPSDLSQLEGYKISESSRNITTKGLHSCGTSLVPKGSMILSCRAPIGSLAVAGTELCTNQGCKTLVPTSGIPVEYYYYYFSTVTNVLNNLGRGSTFLELSTEDLTNLAMPLPSISESYDVVEFLDHETAQIDTLIEKQQTLIQLLKEKRQAVISHAVTKGLNPDAPMKDSGVEWLGEVPEHWEVTKLGFHTSKIGSGKTPRGGAEVYQEEGILFLRSQNVYSDGLRIDKSESVFISEIIHEEMSNTKVQEGDVLLNVTGGSIGRTCIVPDDFIEANVNQHVCIVRLPTSMRYFVAFVLKSSLVKEQIDAIQTGGNREGLNFEQISKFTICLPPEEERADIVSYIESETKKIDKLLEQSNKAIQLMQERRTALISAAVTGKIDVRGWRAAELL